MDRLAKVLIISLIIIGSAAGFGSSALAITLSFDPCDASILAGDSIDIDVVISGLENDDLGVFDFTVNYDSSVLEFQSYALGSGLGDISIFDASDWSSGDSVPGGSVHLVELSWLSDLSFQQDSFTLATLSFVGTGGGNSLLSFAEVVFGNSLGNPLFATLETGSVDVAAPVPEPATLILLASGLLGMAGVRKKIKKSGYP